MNTQGWLEDCSGHENEDMQCKIPRCDVFMLITYDLFNVIVYTSKVSKAYYTTSVFAEDESTLNFHFIHGECTPMLVRWECFDKHAVELVHILYFETAMR